MLNTLSVPRPTKMTAQGEARILLASLIARKVAMRTLETRQLTRPVATKWSLQLA